VFNIGADHPYTINQLVEVVSQVTGVTPKVEYLTARREVVHAYSDHQKVRSCFGDLIQDVPLAEGVARMFEWVKQQGSRESTRFGQIEVLKNMPASWI
jgi:UDP-glucose 4-epimerase